MANIAFLMTTEPDDIDNYESVYCVELDKFFYIRTEVTNSEPDSGEPKAAMIKAGEVVLSQLQVRR